MAGKTGKPDDGGPAKFYVTTDPKTKLIFINYDKPTAWVALTPEIARRLGQDLIDNANSLGAKA